MAVFIAADAADPAWLVNTMMIMQESNIERRRLELPASTWCIPSITAVVLVAALVVAVAA